MMIEIFQELQMSIKTGEMIYFKLACTRSSPTRLASNHYPAVTESEACDSTIYVMNYLNFVYDSLALMEDEAWAFCYHPFFHFPQQKSSCYRTN